MDSSLSTSLPQHADQQLWQLPKFPNQVPFISPLFQNNYPAYDNNSSVDPLLTSSWEALDKLVSASMSSPVPLSGVSDIGKHTAAAAASASLLHSSMSPSYSEVDQIPLQHLYNSSLDGGVCMQWNGNNVGLNLASFISADPAFVERAAKFSSYSQQINQDYNHLDQNINNNIYSSDNRKFTTPHDAFTLSAPVDPASRINMDNAVMKLDSNRDYTAHKPSNHNTKGSSPRGSMVNNGSKKKRAASLKDGEVEDGNHIGSKRAKVGEMNAKLATLAIKPASNAGKTKPCSSPNSGQSEAPKSASGGKKETPKIAPNSITPTDNCESNKPDFIHVRARRGQATDSHSLAERVRREKISERMKYLQDLVPGCTKVTGKAMMLDEIINYVQSLQRQVEFLSMKLAALPPSKLEFKFESLFGKKAGQQYAIPQLNHNVLAFEPEAHTHTHGQSSSYPFNLQDSMQSQSSLPAGNISGSPPHSFGSDAALKRTVSMLAAASSDMLGDCISQITDAWDEDLHNIVHLGYPQAPLSMPSCSLQGALPHGQMKTEV